jgi:hypothetical protein
MAINRSTRKTAIQGKLVALYALAKVAPLSDSDFASEMADIICDILDEITSNAQVNTGIALTTPDTINGSTTGTGTIS